MNLRKIVRRALGLAPKVGRPKGSTSEAMRERSARILAMVNDGKTLEEIGVVFGITRERVRQIAKKAGSEPRAAAKVRSMRRAVLNEEQKRARRDARANLYYGCDHETLYRLNDGLQVTRANSKARKYIEQKRSAIASAIEWRLTFPEWAKVWNDSGLWDRRGRGYAYSLSRIDTESGFEPGNVEIRTGAETASSAWKTGGNSKRRRGPGMSPRQKEVAVCVNMGMKPKQIAETLGITRSTASVVAWQVRRFLRNQEAA